MYVNVLDQHLDVTEKDTKLDSNLGLSAAVVALHRLFQGCDPGLFEVCSTGPFH